MIPWRQKHVLQLLAGVAICALVLGIFFYLTSSNEPSYQGKLLSAWIAPFCQPTPKGIDAPGGPEHFEELQPVRHAVVAIGTSALPFLTARLKHPEPSLHIVLRELSEKQPVFAFRLTDPRVGRIQAVRALAILGPGARASIPDITPQLADPMVSTHAAYALAAMGLDGARVLVDELTNKSAVVRTECAGAFIFYSQQITATIGIESAYPKLADVPSTLLITGLTRIAQDPSTPFRMSAVQRLASLGAAASNAVPALLAFINDSSPVVRRVTIRALGQIKAQPDIVIPALTNALNTADSGTRMAAIAALFEFGYNVPGESLLPTHPGSNDFIPNERLFRPSVRIK